MSTRATYTIQSRKAGVQATYYIHHDGYPAGAANYMMDALFFDNHRDFTGNVQHHAERVNKAQAVYAAIKADETPAKAA